MSSLSIDCLHLLNDAIRHLGVGTGKKQKRIGGAHTELIHLHNLRPENSKCTEKKYDRILQQSRFFHFSPKTGQIHVSLESSQMPQIGQYVLAIKNKDYDKARQIIESQRQGHTK